MGNNSSKSVSIYECKNLLELIVSYNNIKDQEENGISKTLNKQIVLHDKAIDLLVEKYRHYLVKWEKEEIALDNFLKHDKLFCDLYIGAKILISKIHDNVWLCNKVEILKKSYNVENFKIHIVNNAINNYIKNTVKDEDEDIIDVNHNDTYSKL